jgi:hypothetical protein
MEAVSTSETPTNLYQTTQLTITEESHLHVHCMVEEMKVYRFLVGKLEGNRPLRRPRQRWEDVLE